MDTTISQFEDDAVVTLARGPRKVRTPEGAQFYGLPIGSIITADVVAAKKAQAAAKGIKPPSGALSSGSSGSSSSTPGAKPQGGSPASSPASSAAPKPLKVSKPTLTGNKNFSVGGSKYKAPNGSRLVKPKGQDGLAYVVTPEGKVHAFNSAGEVEMPDNLKTIFETKFAGDLSNDEKYEEAEFDATSASYDISTLQEGQVLTDQSGVPQFKKVGPKDWEHIDFQVPLDEKDIKPMFDSGELIPEETPDSAATEQAFADVEAMSFDDMTSEEFVNALDGMPAGQDIVIGAGLEQSATVTKRKDGTWHVGDNPNAIPPANLFFVRSTLSMGKPKSEDSDSDAPEQDAPTPDAPEQVAPAPDDSDDSEDSAPDAPAKEPRPTPVKDKLPTKRPETQEPVIVGDGDYPELVTPDQISNAVPGDRVAIELGDEFETVDVIEFEFGEDGLWTNPYDSTDTYGPAAMKAMAEGPGENERIWANKNSFKPFPEGESPAEKQAKAEADAAAKAEADFQAKADAAVEAEKAKQTPETDSSGIDPEFLAENGVIPGASPMSDTDVYNAVEGDTILDVSFGKFKMQKDGSWLSVDDDYSVPDEVMAAIAVQKRLYPVVPTSEPAVPEQDENKPDTEAASQAVKDYLAKVSADQAAQATPDLPQPDGDIETPDAEAPEAPEGETQFSEDKKYDLFKDLADDLEADIEGLTLTVSDTYSGFKNIAVIKIDKEHRGQGKAQEAMEKVLSVADKEGWTLTLSPTNEFGSSKAKLETWYKTLGFVNNKGKHKDFAISETMYRLPVTPAPSASEPDAPENENSEDSAPEAPKLSTALSYEQGDTISKYGHLREMPEGSTISVMYPGSPSNGTLLTKSSDGTWSAKFGPEPASPNFLAEAIIAKNVKMWSYPKANLDTLENPTDLTVQAWPGGPVVSKADMSDALSALESHSGFQIAYGLKGAQANTFKDKNFQDKFRDEAQKKYPLLKPKPAFVAYLKELLGQDDSPDVMTKGELAEANIRIGATNPKQGVQGFDGGVFSGTDIQEAIDILEAFEGKAFKAELNKKGNALGVLNPNDIVGFNKDKTITKQKFIDLLKAKVKKTEEPNGESPKSVSSYAPPSVEHLDALPKGTVMVYKEGDTDSAVYIKNGYDRWVYQDKDGQPTKVDFSSLHFKNMVQDKELKIYPKSGSATPAPKSDNSPPKSDNPYMIANMEQLEAMLVGSTISWDVNDPENNNTESFIKTADGKWASVDAPGGASYENKMFQAAINAKMVYIGSKPVQVPDYAKPVPAEQEKKVSAEDVTSFGMGDIADAPEGTILVSADGSKHYVKEPVSTKGDLGWTEVDSKSGEHVKIYLDHDMAKKWLAASGKDNAISLKQMDGPSGAEHDLKPGKYISGGKAYMIVKADGTGVYVNSKGDVTNLTPKAVKSNHDKGMKNYEGMPNTVPTAGENVAPAAKKSKPKTVDDLPDGKYYSANPNDPKAIVYEVEGDKVKVYKPKTQGVDGHKKGQILKSKQSLDEMSVGAIIGHKWDGNEYRKNADGMWESSYGKPDAEPVDSSFFYAYWQYKLLSHGLSSEPVSMTKKKINSLFVEGLVLDSDGLSVLPEGHTGNVMFFGKPTTTASIAKFRELLVNTEVTENNISYFAAPIFKDAGIILNAKAVNKYILARYPEYKDPEVSKMEKAQVVRQMMLDLVDEKFSTIDTELPTSDTMALFDLNAEGTPKIPAYAAANTPSYYSDIKELNAYIAEASAAIGDGKIIGQHKAQMDKDAKSAWVNAFKSGNFAEMYKLEVAAAAKVGKPHVSGYLHPGYEGNSATNQINWASAVDGEVSALEEVEGNWSDVSIAWGKLEVDNYLIKASMQNPTYLSDSERRQWVRAHMMNEKAAVDSMSAKALDRKQKGQAPVTEPPTWTDGLKPAKSYTFLVEEAEWVPGSKWSQASYSVTTDWLKDNMGTNEDFKKWLSESDYSSYADSDGEMSLETFESIGTYEREKIVAAYQDQRYNEWQEELKKPVYSKVREIDAGTHTVWLVKDQFDRQYIFKPTPSGKEFRAEVEAKAIEISSYLGFKAPTVTMQELDGETGLMQSFIPNESSFMLPGKKYLDMTKLTPKQLSQVAQEHVLDWILDNDDTHHDNLLLGMDGNVHGIDKGRAFFVYGNWDGLAANIGHGKANTNAQIAYNYLYEDIRQGKMTPEQIQAAYFGALKAARRVEKADFEPMEQMLREGVAKRTNWSPPDYMTHFTHRQAPQDADALVSAVKYRKEHMVEDIEAMWDKIFADAGIEKPTKPAKVFGDDHSSGWGEGDIIDQALEAKVWGTPVLHNSLHIKDGASLLWTEKTGGGETKVAGKFRTTKAGQKKLLDFLTPKAQNISTNSYTAPFITDGFPTEDMEFKWKKKITPVAKHVSEHAVDGDYSPAMMADFEATITQIMDDGDFWSPNLEGDENGFVEFPSGLKVHTDYLAQYKMGIDHHLKMAEFVNTAKMNKTPTNKENFKKFQAPAPQPNMYHYIDPEGVQWNQTVSGLWLGSNGETRLISAFPAGFEEPGSGWTKVPHESQHDTSVIYTLSGSTGELGSLGEAGEKVLTGGTSSEGHQGNEYTISLPTGEKITFRNHTSTYTVLSQEGMVQFELAGDDKQASLERIQDQLEIMGLTVDGAEEEDVEITYWKSMFASLLRSKNDGTASEKEVHAELSVYVSGVIGEPNMPAWERAEAISAHLQSEGKDELEFWREKAKKAYGADKVEAWISGERYLPKYQHMDLSDTEKRTGMPYYESINVDVEALKAKGHLIAIGNTSKDDGNLRYINSGGMLSTEERLRILGYYKAGQSSSSDQTEGSATGVFTRIAHTGSESEFVGDLFGQHVAYWSPEIMAQTGTYSYDRDLYGRLTDLTSNNPTNPLKALSNFKGSGNETLVQHTMSVFDYLEIMVFEDSAKRNEAIQRMKAQGLEMLRGVPIEDRLVMRADLKAAMEKVKKAWM